MPFKKKVKYGRVCFISKSSHISALPDNVTHNEYVFITTNQIIKYNK